MAEPGLPPCVAAIETSEQVRQEEKTIRALTAYPNSL